MSTLAATSSGGGRGACAGIRAHVAPRGLVFGIGLLCWQWIFPDVLGVKPFLLPRLSDVLSALWENRDALKTAAWITFKEAFGGLLLGSGIAILAALVLARWRPLGNALIPYLIAANAIPVIAFAPITNAWFGTLSPWSKIVIAAALCFFPVLVNTLRGLTSVHPASIELMHAYACPQRTIFWKLRIPASMPYLFTALKIAAVLAMIGAVVGDYFGGSTESLGVQIQSAVALSRYELGWAAIVVASVIGSVLYGVVALAERFVIRWHPSVDSREDLAARSDRLQLEVPHERLWHSRRDVIRLTSTQPGRVDEEEMVGRGSVRSSHREPCSRRDGDRAGRRRAATTKVTVQLKWVTQAQFAGFYAAAGERVLQAGRAST